MREDSADRGVCNLLVGFRPGQGDGFCRRTARRQAGKLGTAFRIWPQLHPQVRLSGERDVPPALSVKPWRDNTVIAAPGLGEPCHRILEHSVVDVSWRHKHCGQPETPRMWLSMPLRIVTPSLDG